MTFDAARTLVLSLLRSKGKCKNSELLAALFDAGKEDLLFEDLAEDKKGVGLVYAGPPEKPPPVEEPPAPEPPRQKAPRRVFISYGRADCQQLAFRLEGDLTSLGHQVWLDKRQIVTGESWEEQIERGILQSGVFISLLTPHAVRRPDGVCLDEISLARYSNRKIIPTMVIQCPPALGIYRLDWVDFQEWDRPQRYAKALARVLEAFDRPESAEGVHANLFASLKPLDFGEEVARLTRDFTGRAWLDAELKRWLEDGDLFFRTLRTFSICCPANRVSGTSSMCRFRKATRCTWRVPCSDW